MMHDDTQRLIGYSHSVESMWIFFAWQILVISNMHPIFGEKVSWSCADLCEEIVKKSGDVAKLRLRGKGSGFVGGPKVAYFRLDFCPRCKRT